jgi:16S rRNA (uracil1498-N3)-methyltransferase
MGTSPGSAPRLYYPGPVPADGLCSLSAEQAHHFARVLRLTSGDALIMFDGRGMEYRARIEHVTQAGVRVRLLEGRAIDRESPLEITLAQGISSGERMDYTVQKAIELGVSAIQPLAAERSVVRLSAERAQRRVAHWQAVAIAACEQCGRNTLPPVRPILRPEEWLAARGSATLSLMLDAGAGATLRSFEPPPGAIVLLAGPEGGFAPAEKAAACAAGFAPVRLGPRVLRTETAALAALAAMQALWGDF